MQQQAEFAALLHNLGQASDDTAKQVLAERDIVEPESDLAPEVVARVRQRMTQTTTKAKTSKTSRRNARTGERKDK